MNLQDYIKHRRRYEVNAVAAILVLIGITNATSIILENYQAGLEINWLIAFATEMTAVLTVPILFPLLFPFLNWLNLSFENIRWRILWHIPGFVVFALLHIALFNIARKMLWPLFGEQYEFGPIPLGLLYEMRKIFWAYLVLVVACYCYRFILDRLQGEAKFLSSSEDEDAPQHYRDQFLVKMLNREFLVPVEKIEWIESAGNYVLLNCGERKYPMRQTLKGLSDQLDPDRFLRIHRSTIVNICQIHSLHNQGGAKLQVVSGEYLPVSKTYLPELRQALLKGNEAKPSLM